ncbi:GTPase IMAP family member 4-like isoform X2 [Salarias fasciatus]|uniref:GTPase IMAP family member 4-like isoform X2 n=1 Tax=Salarias fasciatus TaxID=181472 RepID=UPI0011770045|nr:GTPase IMAP family member 4-like isoform X2 [Salarias fasciatus]
MFSAASAPIPPSDRREEKPLKVILLGKTGTGKSQFGNALIGKRVFEVNSSADSGTSECHAVTKRNGEITVVDTPGFFDNCRDEADLKPEIVKSITECSPGPHAFLIVLKVEKFTEQEKQIITKIRELFSEEAFKYAVLVFTRGDDLDEGERIEKFVIKNKDLKELLAKCGGRCHVVDNKYWNNNQPDCYRDNQFQIRQLLYTINEMVKQNGGGCYTNEMLQEVEREIREETERTGSREEAKKNVFNTFLKKVDNIVPDMLLGGLLGKTAMVKVVRSVVFGLIGAAGGAALGAAAGALAGPLGIVAGAVAGGAFGGLLPPGNRGSGGYKCLPTDEGSTKPKDE